MTHRSAGDQTGGGDNPETFVAEIFEETEAAVCAALAGAAPEAAPRIAAAVEVILGAASRRRQDFRLALGVPGPAGPAVLDLQVSTCGKLKALLHEARAESRHPPPPARHEELIAWGFIWWLRYTLERGEDPVSKRSEILQVLWLSLFDHERLPELEATSR